MKNNHIEKLKISLKKSWEVLKDVLFWIKFKLKNLFIEHKVLSSFVGLFLLSSIIAFAVQAASGNEVDKADATVSKVDVATSSENKVAKNFTSIMYSISYMLDDGSCKSGSETPSLVDNVTLTATLADASFVKWLGSDESSNSSVSEDGKTITIVTNSVSACSEHTLSFSAEVLNAERDSVIQPEISIKAGSKAEGFKRVDNVPTVKTSYDKELVLSPLVRPGIAQKTSDGRNVKFGVMLGFKSNEPIENLTGIYFKTSSEVILKSYEVESGKHLNIYTKNEGGDYFGINSSNKNYFASSVVPDLSSISGKIDSIEEFQEQTLEPKTNELTNIFLYIPKNIELDQNASKSSAFNEYSVSTPKFKIGDQNLQDCKGGICNIEYYKDGKVIEDATVNLNEAGNYEVKYSFDIDNNRKNDIIITQNIKVSENSGTYSLIGEKTQYVMGEEQIEDKGIYDNEKQQKALNYVVEYYDKDDSKVELPPSKVLDKGTYTQKYLSEEGEEIGKRTIIVIDESEQPSVKSKKVSVDDNYISINGEYKETGVKLDDGAIDCKKEGGSCTVFYQPSDIDTSNAGNYTVSYKIVDDNIEYFISKNVSILAPSYKMKISSMNPSGKIVSVGDNFYAVGAYYVTVNSPKVAGSGDIKVALKAKVNDSESIAETVNGDTSIGTNSLTNDFYVTEQGLSVKVDNDQKNSDKLSGNYYTAAMGEEVVLKSVFDYGFDADDNIDELKIEIPVNENLIPIAYSNEVTETSSYVGLNITQNGSSVNGIPKVDIKYCLSASQCINPEEYKNEEKVDHIEIKISKNDEEGVEFELKPGTKVELNTKYKVRTVLPTDENLAKDITNLKFSAVTKATWGKNTISADETKSVYITPYKIRSDIKIGKKNGDFGTDLIVDASKNLVYTYEGVATITAPAMSISSNILGYDTITSYIMVQLPKGINYIYNSDYSDFEPLLTLKGEDGSTLLLYYYPSSNPNSVLERIKFDYNFDVELQDGDYEIKTIIGNMWSDIVGNDTTINNDVSSVDKFKTDIKKITVKNAKEISYAQYIYSNKNYANSINQNSNFEHILKLKNNSEQAITNLSTYTILPYNSEEDTGSKFNGELSVKLPDGAMCTEASPADIQKENMIGEIKWTSCNDYKQKDGYYSGFTAFKLSFDKLDINKTISNTVEVKVNGNKPADKYLFKSYLKYDGSKYISFKDASVEVISKKIMGIVWEDFNVNGLMEDDEKKVSEVTLKLFDKEGNLLDTTTPNEKGEYSFSGLKEGDFYIEAEFNNEKYGITAALSDKTNDKSKISVFKEATQIDKPGEDKDKKEGSEEEPDEENPEEEPEEKPKTVYRTDTINIGQETRLVKNINLGLVLKKNFELKINKYVTRAEITNALGVRTIKEFGNAKLAKIDVKDMNKLNIKVVYLLEIENVKHYPGYATIVSESIPDGMSFNPSYEENKGWTLSEDGYLINESLKDEVINEGEKKYLTIAFDISRKEAGSFINYASIDELTILGGNTDEK